MKKNNTLLQRGRAFFAFTIGIGLLVGILTFQHPMEVYAAIDPGLDSGNATIDRTSVPGQTILKYTTTGNSTFKAPAGVTNVRVLVVGGGGGGGAGESNAAGDAGGGGGAGEYIHQTSAAITPGVPVTVTVGGGGGGSQTNEPNGGTTAQNGASGGNSVFSSLTARGGGGAGGNDQGGLAGGSGGGAGGRCSSGALTGGASTAVAPGVGTAGGSSPAGSCTPRGAAGGGGAAVAGASGSGGNGGIGGTGLQNDVTGTNAFYAGGGGGGGGKDTGTGANGGSSVGGKGGNASGGNGANGTVNTGSGGGGGGSVQGTSGGKGGAGGSGIVIVRFATQDITSPNNPAGVAGATMWYKADSAGNTNAQWNDSSGFGYNITQGTASKQPVLTPNSVNFNPAYVFDGTDDVFRMDGHGIGSTQPMSAFFGANLTRTDGGYRYLNEFGDDSPSLELSNGKPDLYVRNTTPITLTYSTVEALAPHIYSFISPNANNQSRIVGVDNREESQNVTSGTYPTSNPNGQAGNSFGNTNGSSGVSWAGPIAEAIYFNKVLTVAERQQVNSYLAIKYGVTLGTGTTAYLASDGSTIYPADATFKNNIAGIGRDDASTLNQKQSKSTSATSDIVTIGHGTIAADNQANTNNFTADRSFLLWGHNNAATNTTTAVASGYVRMDRIWKAVRANTVGQVKVQIPASAVTGSNGVMYVSSSTTFDGTAQRTNMTLNGANYEANVTLPAGTSYFSFGSLVGADIEMVSKTATDIGGTPITSYTPGESIEYKLTVKNNGPDNSGIVTVTDTLPAGVVPVVGGASGGGWNCNVSTQTVTCTRPVLNSGATAPDITIEATIASNVTGAKNNTATASVSNDPDNSNNSASLNLPAAPKADLSIAKGHTGTPVAGQNHTYKFTITNNGPSDVASFTVTDQLNSEMTLVSSSNGVACAPVGGAPGQNITCTGGALTANGATSTKAFDMVVNVSGTYGGGTISNTGTVAVPVGTIDPNSANNSSTDASNVLVDTQVGVAKTHTGNFTAGENNDFTITVDNQGPSTSPVGSITVTDTLDEDFTYVPTANPGWNCSLNTSTVTCTNTAAITAGGSSPITLRVLVDPIAKGVTTNTAEVTTTTPDSDLSDNISLDDPVTIASTADLGITKAHVGTAFTAGQQEQYTLSVVNNGPSADSPSYTISDTLPASLSFVSATGAASCTNNLQVVTCTGGAIGAGDPPQVTTITVAVGGSATGTINNTATVAPAAGTTDPVAANNSSTDNVNVEPNADLSIAKTHTGNLTAGDSETYTLTTTNNGPSNVASYTVTDTLDSDLTFVSSVPGPACSVTGTTPAGEQEITCNGGAITNGNNDVITVTVTVEPTVTPGSTIANTATVAPPAGVNDPNSANNNSTVNNTVDASADLEVTKSHTGNFTAGSNTNTFTIAVKNNGPSDASTFTVTDTLPAELTYVSATGPGVGCINASQTVTCTYGPIIPAGQTVNITLTVGVGGSQAGGSTIDNTASVSSATPDPTPGNNSDTDTVTVDSIADLGITKTNDTDFTAGSDEDYTIQVTNAGPSNVAAFTVSDTLPADLTYVTSIPNICSATLQVVTCTGGALASGASTSFKIKVHTDSGLAPGTVITNTATVATVAPTTDPNNANNSSTDPTTIVTVTDLSIQKNPTGTYVAGKTGQFTFTVSNAGPSNAPAGDVEVTDALPTGLTFASGTGTGWDCIGSTVGGQDVSCTYTPSLAVSATTPVLTVTVNIAPDKQGEVTNTGTVVSTLDDSTPANDTDSATVDITAEADLTATKTPQGTLTAGENVTYRFEVTNDGGPSDANDVTITDNLQGHYTYQSFNTVSGGTWSCSEASGTVTCDLSTPLAVGGTAIVDVTLKVAENVPNPLENTAAVTFNGTDPTPANPTTSDPVSYSADLEIDITHEQKTYRSGDTVNMTYTIKNHGPSAAQNVVMTSTIPSGFTVTSVSATAPGGSSILASLDNFFFPRVSAAPNPFTCSLNGQQLTCNTSTLLIGTYPLYITGQINNSFTGQLVFAANITSSTPDPNASDVNAIDVISGILPGLGLAGTGQSLWPWVVGTLAVAMGGGLFIRRLRLRKDNSLS